LIRRAALEGADMSIRVVYYDNKCDTIPVFILQLGIDCNKIKMFYRASERKWATVGTDPIRTAAYVLTPYAGIERRGPEIFESSSDKDELQSGAVK